MSDKIKKLLARAEATANERMSSVSRAESDFANTAEAEKIFAALKEKLFRIEKWNAHSNLMSFELFGAGGEKRENARAKIGDFVRVSLIGAGKSDWVKIVRIDDDETEDEIVLTLQPAPNPTEKSESATSHFFTRDSTNNFCLQRTGARVAFYVVGLNEKTNVEDTKNFVESARNAAVANLGHYLGVQHFEWQTFCKDFLNK